MNTELMFSSKTDLWATPQAFFDELDKEFHFDLDVCATPENAKCSRYFTGVDNGLAQEWTGVCWMNPPYGRGIGAWVEKAYRSSLSLSLQPLFACYRRELTPNGFRTIASSMAKSVLFVGA